MSIDPPKKDPVIKLQPIYLNALKKWDPELSKGIETLERFYKIDEFETLSILRRLTEKTCKVLCSRNKIDPDQDFAKLITDLEHSGKISKEIANSAHFIRKIGNRYMHLDPVKPTELYEGINKFNFFLKGIIDLSEIPKNDEKFVYYEFLDEYSNNNFPRCFQILEELEKFTKGSYIFLKTGLEYQLGNHEESISKWNELDEENFYFQGLSDRHFLRIPFWINMGIQYANIQLFSASAYCFQFFLFKNPNLDIKYKIFFKKEIGFCYLHMGMLDIAERWFKESCDLNGDVPDSEIYDGLAIIYEKQLNYEKAITEIKNAIKMQPNELNYWMKLYDFYVKSNYDDLAFKLALRFFSINPGNLEQIEQYIHNPKRAFFRKLLSNIGGNNHNEPVYIQSTLDPMEKSALCNQTKEFKINLFEFPEAMEFDDYCLGFSIKEGHVIKLGLAGIPDKLKDLSIVSKFPKLNYLNLKWNNLDAIPNIFNLIPDLEELYISYNSVKELPESFYSLHKLRILDLEGTRINLKFPKSMPKLEYLNVLGSHFSLDPDFIEQCPSLKRIQLSNYFDRIPTMYFTAESQDKVLRYNEELSFVEDVLRQFKKIHQFLNRGVELDFIPPISVEYKLLDKFGIFSPNKPLVFQNFLSDFKKTFNLLPPNIKEIQITNTLSYWDIGNSYSVEPLLAFHISNDLLTLFLTYNIDNIEKIDSPIKIHKIDKSSRFSYYIQIPESFDFQFLLKYLKNRLIFLQCRSDEFLPYSQ
jgi:tetratricopeptide (TPR) repeat protein